MVYGNNGKQCDEPCKNISLVIKVTVRLVNVALGVSLLIKFRLPPAPANSRVSLFLAANLLHCSSPRYSHILLISE